MEIAIEIPNQELARIHRLHEEKCLTGARGRAGELMISHCG